MQAKWVRGMGASAIAALAVILSGGGATAESEETESADEVFRRGGPKESPLARLVIRTEFIEVNAKAYAQWTSDPKNSCEGPELRAHVQQLIKEGKARLRDLSLTAAKSGERVKNESVTFLIHPSEFGPPKVAANGSKTTPAIYTATECRNLGYTVECDPVLSRNGKMIDLNLAPEIVTESGETRYGNGEAEVAYPKFDYLRAVTQVAVAAGSPVLIAVLSEENPESSELSVPVLVFVQADVHQKKVPEKG